MYLPFSAGYSQSAPYDLIWIGLIGSAIFNTSRIDDSPIVIDLKSDSKTLNFKKNDVILYDGKQWYITSKESLLADLEDRCTKVIAKVDQKMHELGEQYSEFLLKYNQQNAKLLPIIENLLEKDEEKWKRNYSVC